VTETRPKPASLECPTMVSANGASPVMGIIEDLNPKVCRMRSINEFKAGDLLRFDFTLRGANRVQLSGHVVTATENGTRRSYAIALSESDADAIVVALDAARRFATSRPTQDVHTANGLTRASARIPIDVELQYSIGGSPAQTARATNVSTGGILLNSTDNIPVGASLEVRFRLPGADHDITVHARVVAHQHESPNYNMAFFNIDPKVREELTAFVSAHAAASSST
jgi:PilZ domain